MIFLFLPWLILGAPGAVTYYRLACEVFGKPLAVVGGACTCLAGPFNLWLAHYYGKKMK